MNLPLKNENQVGNLQSRSKAHLVKPGTGKKPFHCIEYIIVHELAHLLERSHNGNFIAIMDHFLPEWKHLKNELNKLPISHLDWVY